MCGRFNGFLRDACKLQIKPHFVFTKEFMFRIAVLSVIGLVAAADSSCPTEDASKYDCGFSGINQTTCESKGCCWKESTISGTPWCFYTSDVRSCFGYMVI